MFVKRRDYAQSSSAFIMVLTAKKKKQGRCIKHMNPTRTQIKYE